jgi:hypothetical protein
VSRRAIGRHRSAGLRRGRGKRVTTPQSQNGPGTERRSDPCKSSQRVQPNRQAHAMHRLQSTDITSLNAHKRAPAHLAWVSRTRRWRATSTAIVATRRRCAGSYRAQPKAAPLYKRHASRLSLVVTSHLYEQRVCISAAIALRSRVPTLHWVAQRRSRGARRP